MWPELQNGIVSCNWIWQINQASQIRVLRLAEKYNLFHDEFLFKYEKGDVILIKIQMPYFWGKIWMPCFSNKIMQVWEFVWHRMWYKGMQNPKINICVNSYNMIDMKGIQIDQILYNDDKWWTSPFIFPRRPLSAHLSFLPSQPFPGPLISHVLSCQKLVGKHHHLNFCAFLSHQKQFQGF